jgi:hypothetical protein
MKENELGALWEKEGKKGKYFSGNVTIEGNRQYFVVFRNDKKTPGSNQPDWNILKPQPREGVTTEKVKEIFQDDAPDGIPF